MNVNVCGVVLCVADRLFTSLSWGMQGLPVHVTESPYQLTQEEHDSLLNALYSSPTSQRRKADGAIYFAVRLILDSCSCFVPTSQVRDSCLGTNDREFKHLSNLSLVQTFLGYPRKGRCCFVRDATCGNCGNSPILLCGSNEHLKQAF